MNTSAKGAAYENAFRRTLYERKAIWVMRAAASKGPFDLVACFSDVVAAYQLRSATPSCKTARNVLRKLVVETGSWPHYLPYVVHRRRRRVKGRWIVEAEFCEH